LYLKNLYQTLGYISYLYIKTLDNNQITLYIKGVKQTQEQEQKIQMSKQQLHRIKDQGFIPSSVFFYCLKNRPLKRKIKVEVEGRKWIRINKTNDKENN
jgi:hypothetical protein